MIGQMLAHYRITAKIGEGGMGEVYRATDTKLGREVAIKILPEAFARDPERMARFQREAHVLASLNHPNIAAIYGMEERALVMELVEGETLSGPLPADTVLHYARQLADALDAAHEKGITHRDLKPANVKVTPEGVIKVLDFGLAKAAEPVAYDPQNSPTVSIGAAAGVTRGGVIMGTAAYMSPEQARGHQIDKRTDIWAFGVVLFEILTGKRLFSGETVSDTLAAVLTGTIDWGALPEDTPKALSKLLRRCLERERKRRLRDIADARSELDEPAGPPPLPSAPAVPPPPPPPRSSLPWIVTAVSLLLAAVFAAGWYLATRPVDRPLIRIDAELGPDLRLAGSAGADMILSPDGTRIVFVARDSKGLTHLMTRRLDQSKTVYLESAEGAWAYDPFFSPDGLWVGFSSGGKLKKIPAEGGGAITLCDAPNLRGAAWGEDGNIIASIDIVGGLVRVPSSGGKPETIVALNSRRGDVSLRWPQLLPGGKDVLFASHAQSLPSDDGSIEVASLVDGKRKTVYQGSGWARYLPTGHLMVLNKETLFAVPFDLSRLETAGAPVPLLEGASRSFAGRAQCDFSSNGMALYQSGGSEGKWTIQWLDSNGKTEPLLAKPGSYWRPRLSPDGERLAVSLTDAGNTDIWIYESRRDTMNRLTFDPGLDLYPVWTPDGRYLIYRSEGHGMMWVRADGAGKPEPLLESKMVQRPYSISPDGKRLAYFEFRPGGDLWTLPLEQSPAGLRAGKPELFLATQYAEANPEFSPDGRWLAYDSNESGRSEVYVRGFPDAGGKWQISNNGGVKPVWSRNGRELFFQSNDNRIIAVSYIAKSGSFAADKPRLWSEKSFASRGVVPTFDLAPDGKRFAVMMEAEDEGPRSQVTFLLNFFDEVRRRAPAR
jgi:serine/threonine-protein kinase